MTLAEKLAKAIHAAEEDPGYWIDIAVTDFTHDLHDRMRRCDISQGELARRMGTSRPYVTKLLSGGNFTLQTMVKLAMALDAVVRVRLEGNEARDAQRQVANTEKTTGLVVDLGRRRAEKKSAVVTSTKSDSGVLPLSGSWGR